jgi:phosphoglycerol transferase MdoB-like AlkP superfamily enzyme
LFTTSSHHPYYIPEHMRDKVKRGPQPICASINYGDYALMKFFEEAKKQPWYKNTLFVILADHTPGTNTPLYNARTHLYRIPILFYHPGGQIKPEKSDDIFQQLDIMPTILDLLNIKIDYYGYGISRYEDIEREALMYLGGSYFYYKNSFMTSFVDEKARNLYDFTTQSLSPVDSISYYKNEVEQNEKRFKAMLQRYNRDLLLNQTTVDEKKNSLHN